MLKLKKCKNCTIQFAPRTPLQYVCSPKCGIERTRILAKKKEDKDWKDKKKVMTEKLMGHSDYIQLLQKVFNTFIRLRDAGLPCISCKTTKKVIYAAGHFHPTTYSYLRFNEDNVHLQCNEHCNRQKRGNLSEYRPALIKKIGIERVEKLDADRHKELNLSIPEIKELIIVYKHKIKQLNENKKVLTTGHV
ncbi:MAG: recombination protein NinG [Bacteroidota bacterium]